MSSSPLLSIDSHSHPTEPVPIPAEIQAKIFDPFFTTKPIGSGTGLGLAIAYQTLQNHNGRIRLNPEDSNGTEFIIDLPLSDKRSIGSNTSTSNPDTQIHSYIHCS